LLSAAHPPEATDNEPNRCQLFVDGNESPTAQFYV